MEKYAPVLMTRDLTKLADPDGNANWFWQIYGLDGEMHYLFGQGVTHVTAAIYPGVDSYEREGEELDPVTLDNIQPDNLAATLPDDFYDVQAWRLKNQNIRNLLDEKQCRKEETTDGTKHVTTDCTVDSVNVEICLTDANQDGIPDHDCFERDYQSRQELEEELGWYTDDDIFNYQIDSVKISITFVKEEETETLRVPYEFANVTNVAISDHMIVTERDNNSVLSHAYNEGTPTTTYTWLSFVPDSINGQKISKFVQGAENGSIFVLSDTGDLYAEFSENYYGMLGIGNTVFTSYTFEFVESADSSYSYITNPTRIMSARDGSKRTLLVNVTDVSVGKKSVCALNVKKDEDGNLTPFRNLYCWGSSTFGQLGFDNGDGGFSFEDTLLEWTGSTSGNRYFDQPTRMNSMC